MSIYRILLISLASMMLISTVSADELRDLYAWKSQEQIRSVLGEPESQSGPVGTHAQYVQWRYPEITVTFANGHVIHVSRNDSLHKRLSLEEDRPL